MVSYTGLEGNSVNHDQARRWRQKLRLIVFGVNTRAGKAFDVGLLWAILFSVALVILESVPAIGAAHGKALRGAEWFFTILFTLEYGLRIWIARRRRAYVTSFFGVIDLLAILPTYVVAFVTGSHSLSVVRAIRLIRLFRVFKLVRHLKEAHDLIRAMKASRPKLVVFISVVLTVALVFGTIMYLLEGEEAGFTSIPTAIYWAVVTMTTVGYGDIAPQTAIGQFLALCLMILGYAIIAVPTGIVSVEFSRVDRRLLPRRECPKCLRKGHERGARFCNFCGATLVLADSVGGKR